MIAVVVPITAARRGRLVRGQRAELPRLEDLDDYIALTEEELASSRLKLARLPIGTQPYDWTLKDIIALRGELQGAQEIRATVLRRAALTVVRNA